MEFKNSKPDSETAISVKELEPTQPGPEVLEEIEKEIDNFMEVIPSEEEAIVDTFVELTNGRGEDEDVK